MNYGTNAHAVGVGSTEDYITTLVPTAGRITLQMEDISKKVVFRVKRITYARRQCSYCSGTGKISRGNKQEICRECKNGIALIEHHTEVDLLDALEELKLIKRKADETGNNTTPQA